MLLISDGLLIAGAFAAAFYCFVLGRRVRMLGNLDRGLGASIAGLSQQVEDLQEVLSAVKAAAGTAQAKTDAAAERAERAANRLQLLLASTQLADERNSVKSAPAPLVHPPNQERVVPDRSAAPKSRDQYRTPPQPGELA